MIKNYFSTISFLLLFIGLQGFSKSLHDVSRWSTPVSVELVPVPLFNLPDTGFHSETSTSDADFLENLSEISRLAEAKTYISPECPTEGESCDDGNQNTINDALDADCNCVGVAIALSCEETEISYQINNSGARQIGGTEITVGEGESVELFANLSNYTLRDPNGAVVNANTINNISTTQAGVYTINTTFIRTMPTAAPLLHYVDSEETQSENAPATNALDGNPQTFWHTEWEPGGELTDPGYPHEIQLDMGANSVLSGFTYLPRQNGAIQNGRVAGYEIYVSNSTSDWGDRVASGTWGNNTDLETVNFPAKQGRYLRFVAVSPFNPTHRWASAAEISVRRGASVQAVSSAEVDINPASYAADGNPQTFWHSRYTPTAAAAPHHITLDLGIDSNVTGLTYLPRQDGTLGSTGVNGRILTYEIFVSNSTTDWGAPVKTGSWTYPGSTTAQQRVLKTVNFPEKRGRYVRLVAITGVGGFASAAEVRAIRPTINIPCVQTIQINVDKIETYTYNDGAWSPNTPVGVATANDTINITSGDAVISSTITIDNLIVEPGASLTVDSGAILNATTTTLKSRSDSYSSLIVNGELNGVVNYGRWVNKMGTAAGGGNDLISSPLTNATFNDAFRIANPNLPENPSQPGVFAFAPFNVISGAYENYDIGADYSGEFSLVSGTGYRAATRALAPQTGNILTFTGEAITTDINIAISDGGLGKAWNLIGNPYPSYLHFETFFDANLNEFRSDGAYQAVYGYNGNSNDWITLNKATATPDQLIAPGQGFFVKAKAGGGNVLFTTGMRRVGSSNDFIADRPLNSSRVLSKLKLSSVSKEVTTSVYFINGTTRGLDDGYDAAAYAASKVDFSIYTKLLEDNAGLDISIQSLPFNDFNDVIVPLGIKTDAGKELIISIDDLSTLPSSINVYLEDTQNKTLTLLNNKAYKFTPTTAINGSGRFNLHYSAKTLSVEDIRSNGDLRIYTSASPKSLFIVGQLTRATTANLYDIQGRLVLSKALNANSTKNTMDISTLITGVYVVKVNDDNQIKTQRVIIK